ncbi:MAG: hypothetical protein GXP08_10655 [Gammaproteobacteria bacterium]|nr:hypothetical protein [Gammaproteobacteria bacterium]
MDIKIITGVILLSILAFIVGIFIPTSNNKQPQYLPWQIEHSVDGTTEVFGITLNVSTLQQAQQTLRSVAEISQFISPGGDYVVEAYFNKVSLSGLTAKVVLTIELSQETLHAIYNRGSRISRLGNGTNRVTLQADDQSLVLQSPVSSITYLPGIRLSEELLQQRFGQPSDVIQEPNSTASHWLYPKLGLDITLKENGNAVLQYISPDRFLLLTAPLMSDVRTSD